MSRAEARAAMATAVPFRVTHRDMMVLESVLEFRTLTSFQIAKMFFRSKTGEPSSRCLARLRRLHEAGYLRRIERAQVPSDGRLPYLYVVDRRGVALIAAYRGIDPEGIDWSAKESHVSSLFIDHLLATNDVRIAITLSAQSCGWEIADWLDERALGRQREYVTLSGPKGDRQRAAVVPDGHFVLKTDSHVYRHFLELDRSTETGAYSDWGRRDWARRIRAYVSYVSSGAYQARYGARGLRILTVTITRERLINLKRVTEDAGGRNRFWFATLDDVTQAAVLTSPIWAVAGRDDSDALTALTSTDD